MTRTLSLIIAEKPSVARDIARAIGRFQPRAGWLEGPGRIISWAVGHLLELAPPERYDPRWRRWRLADLPIRPGRFQLAPVGRGRKQLAVLLKLLRRPDVAEVINACDAGREGEWIFRQIYEFAGVDLPVRRLWISSLTPEAICEGMASLRPASEFEALGAAARARGEADWLVGINLTRAATLMARARAPAADREPAREPGAPTGADRGRSLAGAGRPRPPAQVYSIGRVQTPTLALIVERERQIRSFVSEPFWHVFVRFASPEGEFWAAYLGPSAREPARCRNRGEAEAIAIAAMAGPASLAAVERTERELAPPTLFDLTSLQRELNRLGGFTAARTLRIAQELYESDKAITYPRTDSRFLTPDVAARLPDLVRRIARGGAPWAAAAERLAAAGVRPARGRVVHPGKVADHHAIIPTPAGAGRTFPGDKGKLYQAVERRLVAALLPPARLEQLRVEVHSGGHRFGAARETVLEPGWLEVEPRRQEGTPGEPQPEGGGEAEGFVLHRLRPGEPVQPVRTSLREGRTRPPAPYTDATLLRAMETAGKSVDREPDVDEAALGTPATRAGILERLIEVGYVRREGRALRATAKGEALIDALPVRELTSAELTGRWEARLRRIEAGDGSADAFVAAIGSFTADAVRQLIEAESLAVLAEAAAAAPPGRPAPRGRTRKSARRQAR